MNGRGAYPTERAAALAGIPKSTVNYWAREGILRPSVSPDRVRLWSYSDLMGLRVIAWLRRRKGEEGGPVIPSSSMPAVRHALGQLDELDLSPWDADSGPLVAVDRTGRIYVKSQVGAETPDRQLSDPDVFNVLVEFDGGTIRGPDLLRPRPSLRIIPGKLGGAPHIERTRLETQALAALARRGVERGDIYRLYEIAAPAAIDDALDLEKQLDRNLVAA